MLFFVPKLISSTPNLKVMNNILIVVIINNNGAQLFFDESVIYHGEKREKIGVWWGVVPSTLIRYTILGCCAGIVDTSPTGTSLGIVALCFLCCYFRKTNFTLNIINLPDKLQEECSLKSLCSCHHDVVFSLTF